MENKYRKIYVEWWKIEKSTVYGLIAFVVVSTIVIGGGWWAIRNNWFVAQDVADIPKNAARIISFEGDVRITRAATRETILVTKQTYVEAGDTIQTQADGRAIVQMIDQSVYSVRPNSTVVIRDNSSLFGGNNVRVSLDDGQLNVRTDQQPENSENIVEMMDSETQVQSQTDASFNTDAKTNGGEIRISRGSVETTIGGAKTTIAENEFAALNNGKIATREKLLAPPAQTSPLNLAQIIDASGRGITASFTWQDEASSSAASYYLQVSRSPIFASDSILVDRSSLQARSFRLAGLVPGTYYWRLKTTARSGQTSDWNEPWKFSVVKRETSRAIDVTEWKSERVGGNVYIVSGRTQSGMLVRSQGRETFAGGDGSFRLQISTPLSEAAIEFGDDKGNRMGFVLSLQSGRVLRRF
ncbi:MAG: FecR domain-containing protein [Saprospiraceae bacterium]|nr:FecR domain-containing protein [Pyrinomonadaceae bacterium]